MQLPAPQQLLDFSGKVALVTGAAAGIGKAIALRFAQAGAAVCLHYRDNESGASRVADEITGIGVRAETVCADLRFASAAEVIVNHTVAELGAVDILVNNAGVYPVAPLLQITPEQWREVIAANLDSVHFCTSAAAHVMRMRGGGAIVNIASIEALNPAPGHAHYIAAKSGVVMYTRGAARELGADGIRVNAVSPGLIWREGLEENWPEGVEAYTKAAPLGRLGQAGEVADACLFLASPAASWITGANLVVDGGVLTNRAY
jgi:NAD(P)-dependent dehydrogenase (short-subunit alcohol dehydrogenase family)